MVVAAVVYAICLSEKIFRVVSGLIGGDWWVILHIKYCSATVFTFENLQVVDLYRKFNS